ncbi:MAG: RNA polymerase sigma factor, partial [Acidobacteriaceae bacterium]
KQAYNLSCQILGDCTEAQDIVQEAFVRVYFSLKGFRGESAFSSWLHRVVTNLCIDSIRKKGRVRLVGLDETEAMIAESRSAIPEEALAQREARQTVLQGLQALPLDHRVVVVLKDLQDFTYAEIADTLKIPIGTVKSRLNTARRMLREHLTAGETKHAAGAERGGVR